MPGREDAFEALTDCPICLVESSVVELVAPGPEGGVVIESRCRICGRAEKDGTITHGGDTLLGDPILARAALDRWAREEGDPDTSRFVLAHFGGLDVERVAAKLAAGEKVETCFDAVAWLFPGVGAVAGGGGEGGRRDTMPDGVPSSSAEHERRSDCVRPATFPEGAVKRASLVPATIPPTLDRMPAFKDPIRVAARALASVMLGDGVATPADREFVDRTIASWGHPPMREDDLAVWRPHELGFPDDPARTIEAMARLTYVDGQRDATEWRVVREFARAWGVSLDRLETFGVKLEHEHQRGVRRAISRVTSLFVR